MKHVKYCFIDLLISCLLLTYALVALFKKDMFNKNHQRTYKIPGMDYLVDKLFNLSDILFKDNEE